MAAVKKDSEVHITYEDQQQINKFARFNAKLQDVKDELNAKKKELVNLEDAGDELMMLDDDSALIPYQIGEVFVESSLDDTNQMLEDAKAKTNQAISDLDKKGDSYRKVLSDLKVQLYAKFGNNINLEQDEES
ncbi:unnamed protein product [Owenia fusiformis]|uniref:Prefoldin subunit 4 n=1 Tax=Owenia fusiformis TaxID=6347 RepID=A0A8S4NXK9_OWEFU|nr:unnamed protein product [Owenia fusiformis]